MQRTGFVSRAAAIILEAAPRDEAARNLAAKYRKFKSHFQFILAARHRLLRRSAGVIGRAGTGVQRPGPGPYALSAKEHRLSSQSARVGHECA